MCFPREEEKIITLLLHFKNMKPIKIEAIVSHGTFRNLPPTPLFWAIICVYQIHNISPFPPHKRENLDAYYD
jgi:hypothetical protein